jgi:hypothetical protein
MLVKTIQMLTEGCLDAGIQAVTAGYLDAGEDYTDAD